MKHLAILSLCGVALLAPWLQTLAPATMDALCHEDGPIEWLQVAMYLVAAALLLHAGRQRGIGWWGQALVFLAVAGEEMSWGQRLLEIGTPPAIAAVNVQGETTIHNLVWFHQLNHGIGFLGYFGMCLCLPHAPRYVPALRAVYARLQPPLFPAWLLPLPATGFLLTLLPRVLTHQVIFNLDEVGELYVAAGFLGFGIASWHAARSEAAASTESAVMWASAA